ncbi:MAG: penicillin acylase family protein, partial [Longimicrobiales bacterium]
MPTRLPPRFRLLIVSSGLTLSLGVATTCARVSSAVERVFPGEAGRLARSVTIHRDEWGVPHIYGPTDASVAFGMAYAQAEDNFWQVEEDFIHSLGRAAQLYGEASLPADLVRAAFEVERLSREEYAREPRERRRLWDAFALGLDHYLAKHPEVRPRLLTRFEPWFIFARFRPATPGANIDGVRLGDVVATPIDSATGAGDWQEVGVWDPSGLVPASEDRAPHGSNTWAVAPTRTAAGHALLFQNPHVAFFGSGQRYEVHLQSDEGWHFSGFAILGTPVPRAGHNEHLGWSHTNTAADVEDAYELTFDDPADPLAYRHGEGWRRAVEWEDTLLVNTTNGLERRRFRFRKTHHGPIVTRKDSKPVAVRIARFEEGGSLQQWYAMGKATTLEQFTAAMGQTALPNSNTMYADQRGNILYVHGNAVPRRSPSLDWTRPLDGSDPATEWQGYHTLEELPRLLDPPSAWLQNTNSTPFLATAEGGNLSRDGFPVYMAPEGDNARAAMSRRILESVSAWTFEEWANAAFDTRVLEADNQIPSLIDEWERLGASDPDRAAKLDSAINEIREWDRVSAITSSAMTL